MTAEFRDRVSADCLVEVIGLQHKACAALKLLRDTMQDNDVGGVVDVENALCLLTRLDTPLGEHALDVLREWASSRTFGAPRPA